VDWRIYKAIYDVSLHHHWVGSLFHAIEGASIPFMVVVTVALWLFARPGGDRKWKLAAGSGLASAAVALIANQIIHALWDRPRPYESHTISHPWSSSTDASFPSDHASASLAIAFAVVAFDTAVGLGFLAAAILLSVGRLFVGAYYPGDLLGSGVVALASAALVVSSGRRFLEGAVRLVERATDPVAALVPRPARARGSTISVVDTRRAVLTASVTLTLGALALAILLLEQTFD
jgi:undecaprenyl-diphosphatase